MGLYINIRASNSGELRALGYFRGCFLGELPVMHGNTGGGPCVGEVGATTGSASAMRARSASLSCRSGSGGLMETRSGLVPAFVTVSSLSGPKRIFLCIIRCHQSTLLMCTSRPWGVNGVDEKGRMYGTILCS